MNLEAFSLNLQYYFGVERYTPWVYWGKGVRRKFTEQRNRTKPSKHVDNIKQMVSERKAIRNLPALGMLLFEIMLATSFSTVY